MGLGWNRIIKNTLLPLKRLVDEMFIPEQKQKAPPIPTTAYACEKYLQSMIPLVLPNQVNFCACLSKNCHEFTVSEDRSAKQCRLCRQPLISFHHARLQHIMQQLFDRLGKTMFTAANDLDSFGTNAELKELWHGHRFEHWRRYLNPRAEFFFPMRCNFCGVWLPVPEQAHAGLDIVVTCDVCHSSDSYRFRKDRGSPLNQLLLAHLDGLAPWRNSPKSVTLLAVLSGCIPAGSRFSAENVQPFGFFPTDMLPGVKQGHHKLDLLLSVFREELERAFMEGVKLTWNHDDYEYLPGKVLRSGQVFLSRLLLVAVIGDHPAICEATKTKFSGLNSCRRCAVPGVTMKGSCRMYFPFSRVDHQLKTADFYKRTVIETNNETNNNTGTTDRVLNGVSMLFELHSLYGFLVYLESLEDVLHILSGVSKQVYELLVHADQLDPGTIDAAMESAAFDRPNDGVRRPMRFSSRRKSYTCSTWIFMAYPLAHFFVVDLRVTTAQEVLYCLGVVGFYLMYARGGTSDGEREEFRFAAKRLVQLLEERYGDHYCGVKVHSLLHLIDVWESHGHPSNFWCFSMERFIGEVKSSFTTNGRNLGFTWMKAHARSILVAKLIKPDKFQPNENQAHLGFAPSLEAAQSFPAPLPRNLGDSMRTLLVGRAETRPPPVGVLDGASLALSAPRCLLHQAHRAMVFRAGDWVNVTTSHDECRAFEIRQFWRLQQHGTLYTFFEGTPLISAQSHHGPFKYPVLMPSQKAPVFLSTDTLTCRPLFRGKPGNPVHETSRVVIDFGMLICENPLSWDEDFVPACAVPEPGDLVRLWNRREDKEERLLWTVTK
eukprot:m.224569 g.224569  ORF g.224569 m.224569 type:complete len:828 (-) comp26369_c0_seq6:165-2648(-)